MPADVDEMDEHERAALHESLAASFEEVKRGQLIDAGEALARPRATRA